MGLDMFAFTTSIKPKSQVDFEAANDEISEIKYWRKHPNLHGWMEALYYQKGGKSDSFNCVNVQLNESDLKKLKRDIETGKLPSTSGFFFGQSLEDEDEKNEDLEFVKTAEKAIKDGGYVFYSSWW